MNISSSAEARFYGPPRGKRIFGDGYCVSLYPPIAIRYTEGENHVTLSAEFQTEDRQWAAFLPWALRIFFANYWIRIDIEDPLVWDNSTDMPVTPENVIIQRIEKALKGNNLEICRAQTR